MKDNYTHICCITDRSGSMRSIQDEVIGGFNTLVEQQRKEPGECTMTYVQFDNEYEIVFADTPLDRIPELTKETFVPRGMTALLDAVGRTVVRQGEWLAAMDEADRPSKVICLIITDGQENASHEYKLEQIHDMIQHQTNKYAWEFVYLGADDKAFEEARNMGLKAGNVAKFAGTHAGTRAAYGVASQALSSYRKGGNVDSLIRDATQRQQDVAGSLEIPTDDSDESN